MRRRTHRIIAAVSAAVFTLTSSLSGVPSIQSIADMVDQTVQETAEALAGASAAAEEVENGNIATPATLAELPAVETEGETAEEKAASEASLEKEEIPLINDLPVDPNAAAVTDPAQNPEVTTVDFDPVLFDDGTSAAVSAPEGAFPEDVSLTVTEVTTDQILDAIREESGCPDLTYDEVSAYDFDFYTEEDHHHLEPQKEISIFFSGLVLDADRVIQVYYVREDGTAGKEEITALDMENGTLEFSTEESPVYAIVELEKSAVPAAGTSGELTAAVGNITFQASYTAEAELPEGTSLIAESVDSADYADAAVEALAEYEILDEKFFDIYFACDGEEIEPKAKVEMKVILSGDEAFTQGNPVKVVHFADGRDGVPEVLDARAEGGKAAGEAAGASAPAKANLLQRAFMALAPRKAEAVPAGSDTVVTFRSSSFSVYGVVETEDKNHEVTYRTTFTFLNDDGNPYNFTLTDNPEPEGNATPVNQSTHQQIVKNGGQLLEVGTPVSVNNPAQKFLYWKVTSVEGTVNNLSEDSQIATLPYDVRMDGATGDAEVTLQAVYSADPTVTYHNFNGSVVCVEAVTSGHTLTGLNQNTAANRRGADQQYIDKADGKEKTFLGWAKSEYTSDVLSTLEITGNTDLYAIYATGHWLFFNKNDFNADGPNSDPTKATYTSPVFIPNGQVDENDQPSPPTRSGYDFDGWYTEADGTSELFQFTGTIAEDTTLYARWKAKQVNYKIVYWTENPDDEGFSYYRYENKTGTAGESTDVKTLSLTDEAGKVVRGFHPHSNSEETGKTPDHNSHKTENAVIRGDGTTVVNVYFDRDIYQVEFIEDGGYTRDNNGDYFFASAGTWEKRYINTYGTELKADYYKIDGSTGGPHVTRVDTGSVTYTYYTKVGFPFSGEPYYKRTDKSDKFSYSYSTIDELTITAKYGADIAESWPSRRKNLSTTYPSTWRVDPNNSKQQSNLLTMPLGGCKFYYEKNDGQYTMKLNYYVQNVTGGDKFSLDHTDTFNSDHVGWHTTKEDYYDLRGFTLIFATKQDADGTNKDREYEGNPGSVSNYKLGSEIPTTRHVSDSVGSAFKQVGRNTYEVNFYYARNQYKIYFTPNNGTREDFETPLYYYQASLKDAAEIAEKNGYVKGKTKAIASDGSTLVFQGWYDNQYSQVEEFDFNGVMPDHPIHLYGKWEPQTYTVTINPNGGHFTDNTNTSGIKTETVNHGDTISEDYVEGVSREGYELVGWYKQNSNGTEELFNFKDPITSDVTIKAHWRNTGTYYVRYVNTSGDPEKLNDVQIQVDTRNYYTDNATVEALGWPTWDGAVSVPEGYEFLGWSYLGEIYKPGELFTVDASKGTEQGELEIGGKKTPVEFITLTAVFVKLDTTYIIYDVNYDGATEKNSTLTNPKGIKNNIQANIPLNQTTTLSDGTGFRRPGYKLIGWNPDESAADDGTVKWALGERVGVNNDQDANKLYAVWAPVYVEITFTKKGGTENKNWPLAGAQFTLSNGGSGDDNSKTVISEENTGLVSFTHRRNSVGDAVLGSTSGNFLTLTEVSAPDGYNLSANASWTVTYNPQDATLQDGKYYVTGQIEGVTNGIINEPETKELRIKKIIDGNIADKSKKFTFTLAVSRGNEKVELSDLPEGVTQTQDGDYTFELSDSGIITFTIPVGASYTISENPDGYKASAEVKVGNGELDSVSLSNNGYSGKMSEDTVVKFTNTFDVTITGVREHVNLAFVPVVLFALAGLAYFSRRRY